MKYEQTKSNARSYPCTHVINVLLKYKKKTGKHLCNEGILTRYNGDSWQYCITTQFVLSCFRRLLTLLQFVSFTYNNVILWIIYVGLSPAVVLQRICSGRSEAVVLTTLSLVPFSILVLLGFPPVNKSNNENINFVRS